MALDHPDPVPAPGAIDFEAIFESWPGLHVALTPGLRIGAVSHALLQRVGKARFAVLGREISALVQAEASEDVPGFLARICAEMVCEELPVLLASNAAGCPGSARWRMTAKPVFDRAGSLVHVLASFVEVADAESMPESLSVLDSLPEAGDGAAEALESPLVLVVEDNPVMNEFVRAALSEKYRVAVAFDADEGLRKARECAPDLIISDLVVSHWKGESFVRSLRQRREFEGVPVLLLAARPDPDLVLRLLREGAQDYVEKPISGKELLLKVDRLLAYRKRAMEEVRRSEERFRLLADSAPVLIWVGDKGKGCTWFNKPWLEFVGRSMDQETGGGWTENVHPEDRERLDRVRKEAFETCTPFRVEYRLRRSDGEYRWLLDHGGPLQGDGAEPTGYIGSCIDIHDRKQMEDQRELLLSWERGGREDAERASRMKDEFLATISHELRTPLQAILGWSRLLQSGQLEADEMAQAIETIERNARAQTRIIEDLLETSRIITGKVRLDIQATDICTLVEAAVETVRPAAAAKGIIIDVELDRAVGIIRGDANRLQQALWNLLSNAIKFTPQGGRVEVELEAGTSNLEIRVSDTGTGIAPEFLDHIFQRFQQADSSTTRRHRGLGLGLAIVRHIVELHGGLVKAWSEGEGKGSTFTVTLPRRTAFQTGMSSSPPAPFKAPGEDDQGNITLRGLKLLVVDDEADALEIVKRVLEKHEAQVATADCAQKALEIFGGYKPDAVISDIGMPERDGYDLLRSIRALGPERGGTVPALALTALARAEDRQRAYSAGYQMHIAKPVEPGKLVAAVARLAGRERRSRN